MKGFVSSVLSAAVVSVLILAASSTFAADTAVFDGKTALATSQAAIGHTIGDYSFLDIRHRPVRLATFRGKPLIITMVYTGCSQLCPAVVTTLSHTLAAARSSLGADSFNAVTIGFNAPVDTPERLSSFARARGADLAGWTFLSGDRDSINRLAADIGFTFMPTAKGFDHLAQTTVVDARGVVYRQVYGADFEAPLLIEPLKDLIFGRSRSLTSISGLVSRVRLLCTLYDPSTGTYRFNYGNFIGMGIGAFSLAIFGVIVVRLWLNERRRRRRLL